MEAIDRHQAIVIRLRLIQAREEAGLSQGQAAKLLGIHRPTLSYVEGGTQRLTVDLLLALCVLYGVEAGDVLAEGYEMLPAKDTKPLKPPLRSPKR